MRYDQDYAPAAYGRDYLRNIRWGYRTRYGEGTEDSPYRSGGSVGRGYGRAADLGFEPPYTRSRQGPREAREAAYARGYERSSRNDSRSRGRGGPPRAAYGRREYARGRPMRRRRGSRPGTAARSYDQAFPYFGSAAAVEGATGYPPGDTLSPEIPVHLPGPDPSFYDDDY